MNENKQKRPKIETIPGYRGELVETLESAVECGTLSAKLLRELAQKFGLKATKKAVAACVRDLKNLRDDVERKLRAIDKHTGVLGLKQITPRR
jgi:hypothetical protein